MCIYIYNYDVYNITLHDVYNYDKTNPSITNIYIYIGILRLTGLFCQQPASRHCGHVMPPPLALGKCNSWA